jgi:hypothetical protein
MAKNVPWSVTGSDRSWLRRPDDDPTQGRWKAGQRKMYHNAIKKVLKFVFVSHNFLIIIII